MGFNNQFVPLSLTSQSWEFIEAWTANRSKQQQVPPACIRAFIQASESGAPSSVAAASEPRVLQSLDVTALVEGLNCRPVRPDSSLELFEQPVHRASFSSLCHCSLSSPPSLDFPPTTSPSRSPLPLLFVCPTPGQAASPHHAIGCCCLFHPSLCHLSLGHYSFLALPPQPALLIMVAHSC